MEKKATLVKELTGFTGTAKLYKLDPPLKYQKYDDEKEDYVTKSTTYVVVSATFAFTENETYIFASNKEGEIESWGELHGSFRGGLDHERALRGAGYST